MNGDSRYHAELHLTIGGREARINCFADTLAQIFKDIGTIASQFPPDWTNPAKREIMNAELKAAQLNGQQPPLAKPTAQNPVCPDCGTGEFMELIEFTDKKTGARRKAWKCQRCGKWYWPPNNGKGQ